MSWWLFLPLAWLATGLNLVVAGDLAWRGNAPDFLLLLMSFAVVRQTPVRRITQAFTIGLILDLSGTGPLGIWTASTILTTGLLSRWTTTDNDQPAAWVVWAFPTICSCAWFSVAVSFLVSESAQFPIAAVLSVPVKSLVTLCWGAGVCLVWKISSLLFFRRDRGFSRQQGSFSFFLSR